MEQLIRTIVEPLVEEVDPCPSLSTRRVLP